MVDIIKCVSSSISHRKSFITYLWNLGPLSPSNPPPHRARNTTWPTILASCSWLLVLLMVHMTWKIFSANLKSFSKYRRMAFFFSKYLFSFQKYWRFSIMQIGSVMTSYCLQLKMVNYWIHNLSGNIKVVFLKLGTIYVHHKRNKMKPLILLP